jgi:hypothetical protein
MGAAASSPKPAGVYTVAWNDALDHLDPAACPTLHALRNNSPQRPRPTNSSTGWSSSPDLSIHTADPPQATCRARKRLPDLRSKPLAAVCRKGPRCRLGARTSMDLFDRVSLTSLVRKYGHYAWALNGMATPVPYRGRVGRVSRSFDCQLEVVPVDLDLT